MVTHSRGRSSYLSVIPATARKTGGHSPCSRADCSSSPEQRPRRPAPSPHLTSQPVNARPGSPGAPARSWQTTAELPEGMAPAALGLLAPGCPERLAVRFLVMGDRVWDVRGAGFTGRISSAWTRWALMCGTGSRCADEATVAFLTRERRRRGTCPDRAP